MSQTFSFSKRSWETDRQVSTKVPTEHVNCCVHCGSGAILLAMTPPTMMPCCREVWYSAVKVGLEVSRGHRQIRNLWQSLLKQKRDSSENITSYLSAILVTLSQHHR
ncbi:hypothetical protein NPIL_441911 [Nephila pilipes]|uniref:Uncharacterized protein n=1 Tax=Nephila pilipes TaxID=299642 RepID=A0A8X6UC63_NEPPI|nr:hypothetical protein NPIL_441911 [Nephila pilipes]